MVKTTTAKSVPQNLKERIVSVYMVHLYQLEQSLYFLDLCAYLGDQLWSREELANHRRWANPAAACLVNGELSEPSPACLLIGCLCERCMFALETAWSSKPKMFPLWPFTENVWQSRSRETKLSFCFYFVSEFFLYLHQLLALVYWFYVAWCLKIHCGI